MRTLHLLTLIFSLIIICFPLSAFGESRSLGHSSGVHKTGNFVNQIQARSHHIATSVHGNKGTNHNSVRGKGHNPHRNHPGQKSGHHGYAYKHNKHHYKNYYGYSPYYGYPAYFPYDSSIAFGEYGTTFGSGLSRPNNIEVNRYLQETRPSNTDEQISYPVYPEEPRVEYIYLPGPESSTIYVWTDEAGVDHYVNNIDLVPIEYRENIRSLSN